MNERLIEFRKEDMYAYIDFEDGELVYGGNVPIHESAKMFIEKLKEHLPKILELKAKQDGHWMDQFTDVDGIVRIPFRTDVI